MVIALTSQYAPVLLDCKHSTSIPSIPPPFWKFFWCTFNIICETKGSWITRAVHSRLILSNHLVSKFDAPWFFQIYKTADFIFPNKYRCMQCQRCKQLLWVMSPKSKEFKETPNYCNSKNFNRLKQTAEKFLFFYMTAKA